ncbi:unnamed protein product [Orchesella dallaii]|uniref:Proton-coupled zinc antiporter SLC30A9, mitochondrial n=1 Tax=Orchesella dallaii TaxID=48710 RepID=A0ABP1PYB8_9HEXA
MHRSKWFVTKAVNSSSWSVLKNSIYPARFRLQLQVLQVRFKKGDSNDPPKDDDPIKPIDVSKIKKQQQKTIQPSITSTTDGDGSSTSGEGKKTSILESVKALGPQSPKNKEEGSKQGDKDKAKGVEAGKENTPSARSLTAMERKFVTQVRAVKEYLLTLDELQGLRRSMRRSPHSNESPMLVYWRRDVEAQAIEKFGSLENLRKERRIKMAEIDAEAEATFGPWNVRGILKSYRKDEKEAAKKAKAEKERKRLRASLKEGSGRIVITAVLINGTNFVIKLLAWSMTGSHSLFAEAIHSLADTINQIILAYGIHKSTQDANLEHPYGYANMRHVASLISGVGIFCVGAGLSVYHGITGLMSMEPVESLHWAMFVLTGSLVSEGATLYLACNSVRKRAKEINLTFREFILRGRDPSLNVVILEDTAAVAGVVVATACMGLTTLIGSPIPDACGSLVIGGLLGGVASFIIYSNSAALVGRSIQKDNLDSINNELENDMMIRAIHDVKGIDMGNNMVRYKAEVDFDGRELTRLYLETPACKEIYEEFLAVKTKEQFENFMLLHGEGIVDSLGYEIDRIEAKLRKSHPEIRHCDLEIL